MMDYMVVNSNMFRSPSGKRGAMSMEKENGSASRCGAMSKNANSTGTDPQAYHSFAKNDEEKGNSVPEKKSNEEEEVLEKPVTTCGMARNGQNYFLQSRPMTPGFIVREDGSRKITDLPHFMKVLTVSGGNVFSGEEVSRLRYESVVEAKMTQEKSVLPMNWGSFLALPIEWLDVRLAEKARRVKLRDVGNGVLDLSLARIFTPCEPAGFNKDFFEEFTGCIGWQVPSNENEAFAMLLSFCAMTRAISTSGAAEGLLKGEVEDKEVQLESYEELKRILWLPTVKTE